MCNFFNYRIGSKIGRARIKVAGEASYQVYFMNFEYGYLVNTGIQSLLFVSSRFLPSSAFDTQYFFLSNLNFLMVDCGDILDHETRIHSHRRLTDGYRMVWRHDLLPKVFFSRSSVVT